MKMPKPMMSILSLSMPLLLMDCATFKTDMQGKFESPSEKFYAADRVSVLFFFSHYRQTKGYDAIPKLDKQRERIGGFDEFFLDALTELSNIGNYSTYTQYASDVNDSRRRIARDSLMAAHDFVVKMKFMREKSFARHFLAYLVSTFSLTLVPMPYSYMYSVNVEIFDSEGRLHGSYARQAGLTKWVQTALIFVYPFHPERRKKEELYVEFMHDIFKQIETEQVLKKE